jgi:hypothetical protein
VYEGHKTRGKNLHPVGRDDVLVKQKQCRQEEHLTVIPQPHGVAKNTHTQHHTIFKGLFSLHVKIPSSSAVSAAAGIVGRTSVPRTKREHKAISRTARLLRATRLRTTARDKANRLASLAHALKSIHGGQSIHWLLSRKLQPRNAHRLVSGGEMWNEARGRAMNNRLSSSKKKK